MRRPTDQASNDLFIKHITKARDSVRAAMQMSTLAATPAEMAAMEAFLSLGRAIDCRANDMFFKRAK